MDHLIRAIHDKDIFFHSQVFQLDRKGRAAPAAVPHMSAAYG
jgi:hypothetical protein